jgi:hypothetical protein
MQKLITLSLLLLTSFAIRANPRSHTASPDRFLRLTERHLILVNFPMAAFDSMPAPKTGLLKKLLQALQFRKNAHAREQARVLEIIARSGLKDSLRAAVRGFDSTSTANQDTAAVRQKKSMLQVLDAIDALKVQMGRRMDSLADEDDPGTIDPSTAGSTAGVDVSVDGQDIQDLVNQVISPVKAEEQTNLAQVRSIVFSQRPLTDTVKISDSVSERRQYKVRRTASIIGFLPYPDAHMNISAYLGVMTELSWYAIGFKGTTGSLTDLRGFDTSRVVEAARARGCRITLCVASRDAGNIAGLLHDTAAQQQLAVNIVTVLRTGHADGLQLAFDNLPATAGTAFTFFIMRLSKALKTGEASYSLGIRVPAYDPAGVYDLQTLKEYADQLLLDFSIHRRANAGPLFPLSGKYNDDLNACVTHCLQMGIPASQLIVCLPYYGVRWKMGSDHRTHAGPPGSISYKQLRTDPVFQQAAFWDPVSATERLDIRNSKGMLVEQVWYDDARSLAAKYDLIRLKGLGGVAIQSLGDDEGYGELWDVLASKFISVDTIRTAIIKRREKIKVLDDWQWSWAYIGAKLEQYSLLYAYPCDAKFPKVLVRKWEQAGLKNNDRSMIRKEEATILGRLSLTLTLLFLAGAVLFVLKLRRVGEGWKWTKPLAGLMIVLFILLTVTGFMYLFLDTSMVYFGVSDSPADCFDFPLGILFIVIFTGITIGVLITRFLVFPLIKQHDIP